MLKKMIVLSILSFACGKNRNPAVSSAARADAGGEMPQEGGVTPDANTGFNAPEETETVTIEPESPEMDIADFGERCTDGVNFCALGLWCDRGRGICLGNDGWPCEANDECAEELTCRDGECNPPGQPEDDDWCARDEECVEEAICSDGLCRYPLGHWCPNSEVCADGLFCSDFHCRVQTDGVCGEHLDCPWYRLCLDYGDDERICAQQREGGPCRFDRQCAAGLVCDSGACTTAGGVPCAGETCEGGFRCVPTEDGPHRCLIPTVGRGCDNNSDCPDGAECVENRCGYSVFAPCSENEECHPGLICDGASGMCLRQEGSLCEEDDCAEQFRCRPTLLSDGLQRCLEPEVGAPCAEDEDCTADTSCRRNRCVRGIGEPCRRESECEESVAVCQPDRNSDCAGSSCRNRFCYLVDGAPCADDDECAWGTNCVPSVPGNSGSAHICRPRIPGIGCDDQSDCASGVPCVANFCGNCGTFHCPEPTFCAGSCDLCCRPPYTVGCLNSCAYQGDICYSEAADLAEPLGMESAAESAWRTDEYRSPNLNSHGEYDPAYDMQNPNPEEGNWVNPWINRHNSAITLQPGDEVLVVDAAWVKETLEGEECPHGPFGKLYAMTHNTDVLTYARKYCAHCPSDEICLNLIRETALNGYKQLRLRGPFRGPPACCWRVLWWDICSPSPSDEFLDGTFMRYRSGWSGIHKWQDGQNEIALSIVESDTDDTDDLVGPVVISREVTRTPCGFWMPFRQYTPVTWGAYPDGTFGQSVCIQQLDLYPIVLRLRTITCTGRSEDPC